MSSSGYGMALKVVCDTPHNPTSTDCSFPQGRSPIEIANYGHKDDAVLIPGNGALDEAMGLVDGKEDLGRIFQAKGGKIYQVIVLVG